MSGRRFWRRAYKHFRIVRRSRREQHQTVRNLRQGVSPGGERREDQASARVSLKGTRVGSRWRGHRTDARKAHERTAPPRRRARHRTNGCTFGPPASAGGKIAPDLPASHDADQGRTATTATLREEKSRAAPTPTAHDTLPEGERTARGDEAQEPRPVTRGRMRPCSQQWVEGHRTTRRDIERINASGMRRRGNGRWVRAAETPRHPRAGATPRRAEPQERHRCSTMRGAPARSCDGSRG
jgi:hypothetical protein